MEVAGKTWIFTIFRKIMERKADRAVAGAPKKLLAALPAGVEYREPRRRRA